MINNQKDTQKISLSNNRHSNVPNVITFNNNPIFDFASKKTEKLITALYMVTDCMETDDALKSKLRILGVELLSYIYKAKTISQIDKKNHIYFSINIINEILSLIEISSIIGFISEMNYAILKREFKNLIDELNSSQTVDKHFVFTLDKKMFEVNEDDKNITTNRNNAENNKNTIKDTFKKTYNNMSFINRKIDSRTDIYDNPISQNENNFNKQERINKILSLIKDSNKDMSIKDISLAFNNCSEKTIQRDLNYLVLERKIVKNGTKRWSRYSFIKESSNI